MMHLDGILELSLARHKYGNLGTKGQVGEKSERLYWWSEQNRKQANTQTQSKSKLRLTEMSILWKFKCSRMSLLALKITLLDAAAVPLYPQMRSLGVHLKG